MTKFLNLVGSTAGLALVMGVLVIATAVNAQALSPAGEGRRAWLKFNCYGCHGMRAQGGMGPDVQHESGEVAEAIRGEGGGMPSFTTLLTPTDITNLRAYLRSIGITSEPTFTHWWEPVPTR
jgi:cytochrome c551